MTVSLSSNDITDERKLIAAMDSASYAIRCHNEDIAKKQKILSDTQIEIAKKNEDLVKAISLLDDHRQALLRFYVNKVGIKMPENLASTIVTSVTERLDREVF